MRFTKPTKARLPKQARAIPYKPKGDESLFRCWNCGFICNEERDDSSGSMAGDNHMVYSIPATGGSGKDGMIISVDIGKECVLMEQDSQGDDKTIKRIYLSVVTHGCPLCGSTNYKG